MDERGRTKLSDAGRRKKVCHPIDQVRRAESVVTEQNVFEFFSPPLVEALKERGFASPTDPQMKLVPLVREGKNALLMAPTGTGKTEAAFLPILDMMIREGLSREKGTKLLYITPLRALNRDMLERMQWWCKRFDIRLGVRHGDSSQAGEDEHELRAPGHTDHDSRDAPDSPRGKENQAKAWRS